MENVVLGGPRACRFRRNIRISVYHPSVKVMVQAQVKPHDIEVVRRSDRRNMNGASDGDKGGISTRKRASHAHIARSEDRTHDLRITHQKMVIRDV